MMILMLAATAAQARPVSYPGGWTVMLHNDGEMNVSHLHYSPSARYSIGWRHEYMRGPDAHMDAAQLNWLIRRWNNPASQANIYLFSGAGVAYDGDRTEPAAFTGLSMDWEDRRWFVQYENRFLYAGDIDKYVNHKGRVGIAPYIGEFGDLHTWLMMEVGYNAKKDNQFTTTPLVRLFKGPVLGEAGYNLQDRTVLFNLMYRF